MRSFIHDFYTHTRVDAQQTQVCVFMSNTCKEHTGTDSVHKVTYTNMLAANTWVHVQTIKQYIEINTRKNSWAKLSRILLTRIVGARCVCKVYTST